MSDTFRQVRRRWLRPVYINKLDNALDWVILSGAVLMLVGLVLLALGGAL